MKSSSKNSYNDIMECTIITGKLPKIKFGITLLNLEKEKDQKDYEYVKLSINDEIILNKC